MLRQKRVTCRNLPETMQLVERRAVAVGAALLASATTSWPALSLSPPPPPLFSLNLPPNYIKLSSTQRDSVLLMAGDFSKLIGSDGAASTISVERLPLRLPASLADAAETLKRRRDAQAGVCASTVLEATVTSLESGALSFEFLTPLVCPGDSSSLTRHTLATALPLPDDATLVCWAGARTTDWDDGEGARLKAAASSLLLLPKDEGNSETRE